MVILNANQLEKSYGARTLFKDLSFGLNAGERVGLVGPNGVGKSTLVKIIAGIVDPDEGQVTRSQGLRVGYLDQNPTFKKGTSILQGVMEKLNRDSEELSKAYQLVSLLGLDQFGEDFLIEELSGGWQKRVALARELILEPQLLVLDEPTNHLDVSGILWLENFLKTQPFGTLMITHDRLFLQRVCQRILDLDPRNPHFLLDVKGDYLEFTEAKQNILDAQVKREGVLKNKLRREKEWLSRGPQARQTKQKARIEEAHKLEEDFDSVKARNLNRSAGIEFGGQKRLPKKLISVKSLGKGYEGKSLFSNFDFLIGPSTRLGFLGDNGSGKSTLIRCLLGLEKADSGEVEFAEDLKVSYFEQGKETLNSEESVLRNVCPEGDHVFFQGQFIHVRSYLERFLFFGHHVDLKVEKLSGGERARLRLAQLMLKEAHVLVLDEPTNDLDGATLDILEEALNDFNGAVILVTHDRFFLDSVCDQILAFPEMEVFADYFQWERWFGEKKRTGSKEAAKPALKEVSTSPKAKRMSYKDKYELENMEQTIAHLEQELKKATKENQYEEMARLQESIDRKFSRWAELEEMSQSGG